MDFLIFYEHINREVENDTLIKYELEKRGYSCEICHFSDPKIFKYARSRNKAKVVVTPWMRYNENALKYLKYARRPYKLVNLQWEQVYSLSGIKSGLVLTHGEAKKAYHTCWGENSRARLEQGGVPKENLKIVGAIQQDYGRPLFGDYYMSKESIAEQYNLDLNKPWILFISSFAYATYPEESLAALAEKYGTTIYRTAQLHKDSQARMLEWIEELLKRSDLEFIYRPHPSERLADKLVELSDKHINFHVISECSVKQWAKVSDVVNLWISTSNAEIASMGIDYNIVRPIPVEEEKEVESMYGETFVDNLEDFVICNTISRSTSFQRAKERLRKLEHFYNYDENRSAYERVADYLEEVYHSLLGQKYKFSIKQKLRAHVKEQKKWIVSWFTYRSIKKPNRKIIDRLPVKPIIKANMKRAASNYIIKNQTEERMLKYLKSHE